MQTEHKIGQLLIIGLPGSQIDGATHELLQTIQPGGVILDRANIESAEQVTELTNQIRAITSVPPLIAVDQEGGRVDRLREILAPMPSADMLRSKGDAATASRMGELTADALRTLGFNLNLAPVLDIPQEAAADNGLQGRYLGSTSGQVINRASAYLEGMQRNGLIGVGKHFPGLGASTQDTHTQLPQINLSKDELKGRDLLPYIEMFSKINSRLVAVLVGHAHYTAYDGHTPIPASISKNIVNGLLRDELGFRGLAITDDLGMGAVASLCNVGEAAVRAVEAGIDMALVCGAPDQAMEAWQAMVEAANRGRIMKTHISRAFDHIARVKSMVSPPHTFSMTAIETVRDNIAELNETLSKRS